jgi:hypothetical protein
MSNLIREAKVWVKRKNGPNEVVRIIPAIQNEGRVTSYELFVAYDYPEYLRSLLITRKGYDGTICPRPHEP